MQAAAAPGQIVPVDSEHSALAQCLRGGRADEVRRARPDRERRARSAAGRRSELADVTPAQALAHPTWDMGPVVTINSATLVNKGLEVIEAHLLFGVAFDRIDVVVHPQSIVHSMVEFVDGSTLAQASPPDMRLPIALGAGLAGPGARRAAAALRLDRRPAPGRSSRWTTRPSRPSRWPGAAGAAGGTAPAVLNAANEECVDGVPARVGCRSWASSTRVAAVLDEHRAGGDGRPGSARAGWARETGQLGTTDRLGVAQPRRGRAGAPTSGPGGAGSGRRGSRRCLACWPCSP